MKVNREELEKKLNILINEYGENRDVINKINKYFEDKNYDLGVIQDILTLRIHLGTIKDIDLGMLTVAMYKATSNESVNPEIYFTDIEIEKIKHFIVNEEEQEDIYPIIFKKFIQIDEDQWIGRMTSKEIVEMYNRNIPRYNSKTQRPLKTKQKDNGGIIQQIDINNGAVNEMKTLMVDKKYIASTVTFNIAQADNVDFTYDEKTMNIIVNSGEINPTDGFHRELAMIYASIENENLDFPMEVRITAFDEAKTNRFIIQEDHKNHIDKNYVKSKSESNYSSNIVNKLNEDSVFHLNNEFTTDKLLVKAGIKKIDSINIINTIEHTFNPKERKDFIKDYNTIRDRFNYIIEENIFLLDETLENQLIWAFYVCLIYKSVDESKWKEYINNNINKFNIVDDIKNINKRSVKKILKVIS